MTSVQRLLTPELMLQARSFAAQNEVNLLNGLQLVTNWSPETLMAELGESFCYPVLSMTELLGFRPDFECLSYTDCVQRAAFIGQDISGNAALVLSDPFDGATEDWAVRRYGRFKSALRIVLVHPDDLSAYFAQQERQLRATDGFDLDTSSRNDEEVAAIITLTTISEDTSAVVKLVNSTIYDAIKLQASDIHLECDAGCLHVLCRIDGVLVPLTQVQGQDMAEQVISRIKVMADLDIAERRIPQDGRFKVRVNGREIDCRVSVMPNIFGEDAV